jgi:hypothetical protein
MIRKLYKHKAELLFTDTDSLCYEIETDDLYQDLLQYSDKFDFSDYPKNHPLYSDANKKVIGKMKDELNGVPAKQFIGLRSKMYSLKIDQQEEKKTAKGISKNVVKRTLHHEDYYNCLMQRSYNRVEQTKIANNNHNVYTVKQRKIGLCSFDNKRYILNDGVKSLAYGNCKICNENEKMCDE